MQPIRLSVIQQKDDILLTWISKQYPALNRLALNKATALSAFKQDDILTNREYLLH